MAEATEAARARDVPSLQLTIAQDVIRQIKRGALREGDHLRERELAASYGVSRSPIRAALALLVERGVVEKRDNRGFFVIGSVADATALPDDAVQALYDRAARDWFARRVPSQFTDRDFQARYDVRRPLASKVLARLAQDGVIERNAGQGWHFPPTLNSRRAHSDSYGFRRILEPAGILELGFRLDRAEAEALVDAHRLALATAGADELLPAPDAAFELNARFHASVAAWSGNQFIHAAIVRQNRLRRLLEYVSLPRSGRVAKSLREHLAILDLLQTGDNLGAAALMREHLALSAAASPPVED